MLEVKAPGNYVLDKERKSIFLAGSIEMGKAENWQLKVKEALASKDVLLLNPRRDYWDSSWEQSIENQQFREQVEWELTAMDNTDIIIVAFVEGTKSPITLLELGLFKDKNMFVCCPKGYWRQGNVEIVCSRYDIPFFQNLENMIQEIVSFHLPQNGDEDMRAKVCSKNAQHHVGGKDKYCPGCGTSTTEIYFDLYSLEYVKENVDNYWQCEACKRIYAMLPNYCGTCGRNKFSVTAAPTPTL